MISPIGLTCEPDGPPGRPDVRATRGADVTEGGIFVLAIVLFLVWATGKAGSKSKDKD